MPNTIAGAREGGIDRVTRRRAGGGKRTAAVAPRGCHACGGERGTAVERRGCHACGGERGTAVEHAGAMRVACRLLESGSGTRKRDGSVIGNMGKGNIGKQKSCLT